MESLKSMLTRSKKITFSYLIYGLQNDLFQSRFFYLNNENLQKELFGAQKPLGNLKRAQKGSTIIINNNVI